MKCYCISGLGADKRAFKNLDFGHALIHIEWIKPTPNESLSSYSRRLSKQIDSSEPFLLLGLSFGGIIACEISNIITPQQTILISSLTNKKDLAFVFKLIGKIKLHKLIPAFLMKPPMFLAYWFFGVKQSDSKNLLKEIISDTDLNFLKWSIDKILNTEPIPLAYKLLRIHGTNDRLISAKQTTSIHWIKGGGHFMIIEDFSKINHILSKEVIKKT